MVARINTPSSINRALNYNEQKVQNGQAKLLVAEGFHQKIPKGYVYFAMAFCLGVEMLQMKAGKPVAHEVTKAS